MAVGVPVPNDEAEGALTDEQLKERTKNLLAAAEQVSMQLSIQNDQLAATIKMFDAEFLRPLRKGLNRDDANRPDPAVAGTGPVV